MSPAYKLQKRVLDVACALTALAVFTPVMVVLVVLIRMTIGSPACFKQVRPGLHEKPFTIYKFRSMRDVRDEKGELLSDAERLTKLGRFMRAWSLDELPQIYNILKGDMSIVGPRPLLYDFFPYYTQTEMRRHEMKPGITGWAQVNGRNELNWDERLSLDVWYVDHASLALDIKIIWRTALVVLSRRGVTNQGHATFIRLDDYRSGRVAMPKMRKVVGGR